MDLLLSVALDFALLQSSAPVFEGFLAASVLKTEPWAVVVAADFLSPFSNAFFSTVAVTAAVGLGFASLVVVAGTFEPTLLTLDWAEFLSFPWNG
jgi:hypothetical protein